MLGIRQQEVFFFPNSLLMGFIWNEKKDQTWVMCRLKIYLFLQLVNLCYSGLCMPCINQLMPSFQKAAGCFPVQHCRGQNVMKPRDTAFTDFFFYCWSKSTVVMKNSNLENKNKVNVQYWIIYCMYLTVYCKRLTWKW